MKTIISVSVLALTLTGCATPSFNYSPLSIAISEPTIGSENTSNVGDVMLRQGKYKEHESLYLPSLVQIRLYTLHSGYYLKQGQNESGEFFLPGGGEEPGRIERSVWADPYRAVMLTPKGEVCIVTAMNVPACSFEPVNYEKRTKSLLTQDSFQQTLIYSGRVGNKINIGYREFSGNLARPAFNNNVEYDLNESKQIAYKGARLEIVEATNQAIKYKVIRNFNDASR